MPFNDLLDALLKFIPPPHDGLILPTDKRYNEARKVWNGTIDRFPCIIVQPRGATDIAAVLRCCAEHNVALTVRGGGHSVAGNSVRDGAVLLDLSKNFKNVLVDPITRLVHVGGGATWNDVDRETAPYGISVPAGLISHTGVGGLTLGGGVGWLSRQAGLTCDALVSVLLITASGEALRLSAESTGREAELWWALRGGGHGLGVAVEFVFKGVNVKEAHVMRLEFPMSISASKQQAVLRAYQQVTRNAPRELAVFAFIVRGCVLIEATATLPLAAWENVMEPLILANPGRVLTRTTVMAAQNCAYDGGNAWGKCYRWSRSTFLPPDFEIDSLWDRVIAKTLAASTELPVTVEFMHLGGRIADVADDATPYRHRSCPLEMHAIWSWPASDATMGPAAAKLATEFGRLVAPLGVGSYANTDGTDAEERAAAVYGPHLERLRRAKSAADPKGLLHSPFAPTQRFVHVPIDAKEEPSAAEGLRLYIVPTTTAAVKATATKP